MWFINAIENLRAFRAKSLYAFLTPLMTLMSMYWDIISAADGLFPVWLVINTTFWKKSYEMNKKYKEFSLNKLHLKMVCTKSQAVIPQSL